MGWMYGYQKVRDVADYIENQTGLFRSSNPAYTWTVLDRAIVGNTYYAAVNYKSPDHPNGYTFAAVILFRNPQSGFGYKDMCESMAPCEVACPLRILDKLTPIEELPNPSYSAEWRAAVRQYHQNKAEIAKAAKAFKPGDTIKLPSALSFGGTQEDTFVMVAYQRRGKNRTAYRSVNHQMLCNIPSRYLKDAARIAA